MSAALEKSEFPDADADAEQGKQALSTESPVATAVAKADDPDDEDSDANRRHLLWQCLTAEAIGTALLLYIGLGAVITSSVLNNETISVARLLLISLCHGAAYATLLYSLSFNSAHNDMSTRHMNPVLTLCLFTLRRMSLSHVGMTIAAQVVGAVAGTGLLYASTPQRAFHYATVEQVQPWQELIMSTTVSFVSLFVLLITNFHHEDRREHLRQQKEARHRRLKAERARDRLGAYGDLHTRSARQREATERTRQARRATQINFTPGPPGSGSAALAMAPLPQPPPPTYILGRKQREARRVEAHQLDGSVHERGGVFHGPITAVRPTTQSVDEYHCLVCGCAIFVCALVGSAISGGFMNPMFVAGLDVLAMRADVAPIIGPFLGGGVAVGFAYLFGESTALVDSDFLKREAEREKARTAAATTALRLATAAQSRGGSTAVGSAAASSAAEGRASVAAADPAPRRNPRSDDL